MAVVSTRRKWLHVNRRLCDILGYSAAELVGRDWAEITQPEDFLSEAAKFEQILAGDRDSYSMPKRFLRPKNGGAVSAEVHVQAIRRPDHAIELIVCHVVPRDGSLLAPLDITPDWIWEAEPDGRRTESNASVETILGYRPAEIAAQSLNSLLHPEDADDLRRRLAEGQGWKQCVLRWRHKNGGWRHLESHAAPILDSRGTVTGYRGMDRDITGLRAMEQRLRHGQKLEAVGRLAVGVAHDFNNLLTVILGYADQTRGKLSPGNPLHGPLIEVEKAGRDAASLTRQLLAFSRGEAAPAATLDLNSVVADTGRMLRRLIGEDIAVSTSLSPEPAWALVEPGQMSQVLINLAMNARDAMPNGGKFEMGTSRIELERTYVVLTVSDTGVGMDEGVRSQLFEPFITTKAAGKGTGLGLFTVQRIVKGAGGHILVESEVGKGTTFGIYLPAACPPNEAPATPVPPPLSGGTETIVLVEDHEVLRRCLVDCLEPLGYTLLVFSDPQSCLPALRKYGKPVDLLLTDRVIPGMSGSRLAEKVEALYPGIAILYMSGYADESGSKGEVATKAEIAKGACNLSKPFTPHSLAAWIREALGRSPKAPRRQGILVIDDDERDRAHLLEVLGSYGYKVFDAANGKIGIRLLQEESIDLVICDLAMPEQEGVETIQLVRRQWPAIKIVAVSGMFAEDVLKMSRLLGADATMAKPILTEPLLDLTHRLLEDESRPRPLPPPRATP